MEKTTNVQLKKWHKGSQGKEAIKKGKAKTKTKKWTLPQANVSWKCQW